MKIRGGGVKSSRSYTICDHVSAQNHIAPDRQAQKSPHKAGSADPDWLGRASSVRKFGAQVLNLEFACFPHGRGCSLFLATGITV